MTKGGAVYHSQPIDSGGGFFIDPPPLSQDQEVVHFEKSEEETDVSDEFDGGTGDGSRLRRKKRRKVQPKQTTQVPQMSLEQNLTQPRPPDEEKPICDECTREFDDSFLLSNFNCQVCDRCR